MSVTIYFTGLSTLASIVSGRRLQTLRLIGAIHGWDESVTQAT